MMDLEHNAKTNNELKEVAKFVDDEIGIEYDIDYDSLTIMILEPEAEEIGKIMHFLVGKGYVTPKRSELENSKERVYEYCASDCNHSIYHFHGHYFDVYDGGWCGGEEVSIVKDDRFILELQKFFKMRKVGRPDF